MTDASPPTKRLLSLDVMRGATIVAMILVNNPGTWNALYWPLGHADWHGWTPTDLIFPFFLFMVGVAMAYSFAKYSGGATPAAWWRIVRRVVVLILLGLLLAGSGQLYEWLLGKRTAIDLSTLRWPGVLQRIALAYLGASLVVLLANRRWQAAIAAGLLLGYAAMLALLPGGVAPGARLEQGSNVVRAIDMAVIGKQHMWSQRPTDPEGLLSTLPSIVTVLIGYATGRRLKHAPLTAGGATGLLVAGLVVAAVGIGWSQGPSPGWGVPINKALWTPSFVLLAGGLGMAALAVCLLLFDIAGTGSKALGRVATAFQMVGVNAIFVFVASGMVARLLTVLKIGDQTVKDWVYQNAFVGPLTAIGLNDPRLASVAYAVAFVGFWWLILWAMWRRDWTIRV